MNQNRRETKLLHKKEIAEIFGYGRDKTNRLLKSEILPVIKINNDYVISAESLDKWLKQNEGREIRF